MRLNKKQTNLTEAARLATLVKPNTCGHILGLASNSGTQKLKKIGIPKELNEQSLKGGLAKGGSLFSKMKNVSLIRI